MAALTIQKAALGGVQPQYENAAAGGDTFVNDGRTFLHVKNGDASGHDVQVDSEKPCSYGFDHDETVSVPAGEERIIGPFARNRFGSPASITYPTGVTSVTIAAVSVG